MITKGKPSGFKPIAMPRVLWLLQKCAEHGISGNVIDKLHYNDLYVMIISIEIQNMRQYITNNRNREIQKRNVEIEDVSGNEMIKFLKGR